MITIAICAFASKNLSTSIIAIVILIGILASADCYITTVVAIMILVCIYVNAKGLAADITDVIPLPIYAHA